MTTNKPETVAWEVRTLSDPKALGISPSYPEWAEGDTDLSITPLVRLSDYEVLRPEYEKLHKDAEFGRSVLTKRESGKKYGCHCDLEEGMEPDGCVIDSGERHHCIYAKTIEVKEQCEYWRVIVTDSDVQEKSK